MIQSELQPSKPIIRVWHVVVAIITGGGLMVDHVEAKRNIERYETEITKWQALSRGLMSRDEMMLVDKKIAQLKERSKNLRNMLHA